MAAGPKATGDEYFAGLRSIIADRGATIVQLAADRDDWHRKHAEATTQVITADRRIEALTTEAARANAASESLRRDLSQSQERSAALGREVDRLSGQRDDETTRAERAEADAASLREQVRRLEAERTEYQRLTTHWRERWEALDKACSGASPARVRAALALADCCDRGGIRAGALTDTYRSALAAERSDAEGKSKVPKPSLFQPQRRRVAHDAVVEVVGGDNGGHAFVAVREEDLRAVEGETATPPADAPTRTARVVDAGVREEVTVPASTPAEAKWTPKIGERVRDKRHHAYAGTVRGLALDGRVCFSEDHEGGSSSSYAMPVEDIEPAPLDDVAKVAIFVDTYERAATIIGDQTHPLGYACLALIRAVLAAEGGVK